VLEYPQSGERIRGRRNIQASRFAQPRDCRKVWGQAAIAIRRDGPLIGRNFCPKSEPRVPL
jgi:hypothetical protein